LILRHAGWLVKREGREGPSWESDETNRGWSGGVAGNGGARIVGALPDGKSALMLVAARYGAGTKWGTKRYLQMNRLAEVLAIA